MALIVRRDHTKQSSPRFLLAAVKKKRQKNLVGKYCGTVQSAPTQVQDVRLLITAALPLSLLLLLLSPPQPLLPLPSSLPLVWYMTEVLNPVGLDPKSVIHFLSELREKTVLALASSKTRKKKFVDKFIAQGKNMFFFITDNEKLLSSLKCPKTRLNQALTSLAKCC